MALERHETKRFLMAMNQARLKDEYKQRSRPGQCSMVLIRLCLRMYRSDSEGSIADLCG